MNRSTLLAIGIAVTACLSFPARAQVALTFTTSGTAQTLSGSSSSCLETITTEDVATVVPLAGGPYSAELFANHLNLNTMDGDGDFDAFYHNPNLAGQIDALQWCVASSSQSMRDLFFSTKVNLPGAGGGVIEPGDVGALRQLGVAGVLFDDVLIRSALGIPASVTSFDIDAVTADIYGTIFLSFEADMPILGGSAWLEDGAVACIPGWTTYYNGCHLSSVTPNAGFIALTEADVDSMCAIANVADITGAQVTSIGDLDGLAQDPNGGFFVSSDGVNIFHNMIFCGENLTGGGILSTNGFGSIALINSQQMATPFGFGPTDGSQVGLHPGSVQSLNGLEISAPLCRFILDTSTPVLTSAGPMNFTAGGADPFQLVFFHARIFGVNTAGGFQPSVLKNNTCFPEWFLTNWYLFNLPADNLGIVDVTVPYGGSVPAGYTILLQGLTQKSGNWSLSAPITLQF